MLATRAEDRSLHCREEAALTATDKQLLRGFLQEHGLSDDIFTFFESLVQLSTENERFVFVKALSGDELLGLAMFARIARGNFYYSLNSTLRQYSLLERLGRAVGGTTYFSTHSVSSPGLPRSFLYTDSDHEDAVGEAILSWMKEKRDASLVAIIDSAAKSDFYARNAFQCFPFASDSWLDVTRYECIDDYLASHKRTRKNLARFAKRHHVTVETLRGDVPAEIKQGMVECLGCSIRYSKVLLPFQDFFTRNIFRTALFSSDRYIHFIIRVNGHIVGFSSRLCCGKQLIGIIGGYNRERAGSAPVYDLMIVTTLEYCIENDYTRLCYGIVDNHTKGRMMDSFREQCFYVYSSSPVVRRVMKRAYRHLFAHELYEIDRDSRDRRGDPEAGGGQAPPVRAGSR